MEMYPVARRKKCLFGQSAWPAQSACAIKRALIIFAEGLGGRSGVWTCEMFRIFNLIPRDVIDKI